jgi:hypothetical protein
MKSIFLLIALISVSIFSLAQKDKESFINSLEKDTAVAFRGTAPDYYDPSVIIKYTGEAKQFFNELVAMHATDPNAVERSPKTIYIPQTNRPFWVYGEYSVYGNIQQKEGYAIIEVWYSAYNRPGNHVMSSAPSVYQKVINRLLAK